MTIEPSEHLAGGSSSLALCPLTLREANDYVARHHRHSNPTVGYKFAIGAHDGERIVGVAIVGRPVARGLDDGWTAEVLRLCTEGDSNVPSKLYAACWRACRAMGYRKLVTYTLKTEPGTSLRAAGWKIVGEVKKRSWDTPSRPRVDRDERQERLRWEVAA
jgi:hypothetical protein